jgi:hypothetical protein
MKGIRIKAVAGGLFTDIAGSALVGLVESAIVTYQWKYGNVRSYEHLVALKSNFFLEFSGLCGTTFRDSLNDPGGGRGGLGSIQG